MEESNNNSIIFITKKIKKVVTWSKEEDDILLELAEKYSYRNWKAISENLEGRTPIQCSARYKRIRPGLTKGAWTVEEDKNVFDLIKKFGKNWSLLAKYMPSRSGKQIRDRFLNTLDPNINKDKFTPDEDKKLIQLYTKYGTSWSKLSNYFPGRTGDMIKNRFYSCLRKKINSFDIIRLRKMKSLTTKIADTELNNDLNFNLISSNIDSEIDKFSKREIVDKNEPCSQDNSNFELAQTSSNDPLNVLISTKSDYNSISENNNDFLNQSLSNLNNNNFDLKNSITLKTDNISSNLDKIDCQMNNLLSNLVETTLLNKISDKNELESQLDILRKMLNYTYLKLNYFNNPASDTQIINRIFDIMTNVNKQN